jgi:8-oxo-dGTP pyrophosphatase MutT (NUDIX family)
LLTPTDDWLMFRIPILHSFDWTTYIVKLDERPPIFEWPTAAYSSEFSEVRWFPANDLPEATHLGVKAALWANMARLGLENTVSIFFHNLN